MSIFNSNLSSEQILSVLKDVQSSIHFIGILGSGMYPLARLLWERGYKISGSDDAAREGIYQDAGGITVTRPDRCLDKDIDMVVYSLAIDEANPQIQYAKSCAVPLVSRAQLLGALMSLYDVRVSVSGSHGKSTVTALIDHILASSGNAHTTVCGAKLSTGESFLDEGGRIILAEACEYKDSFLRLCPTHQLITSVELDHTDYFESIDRIMASFLCAARKAEYILVNVDDTNAAVIADKIRSEKRNTLLTYGRNETADYRICDIKRKGDKTDFTVLSEGRKFNLTTSLIGVFNLYNITAAVAMSDMLGIDKYEIEKATASFRPIDRRMTLISEINDVPVYYDYAHHPSEIHALVDALKERYGTVTLIFRPHTYSRTQSLWQGFIDELGRADFTVLLDIYPAREKPIDGISSQRLASFIKNAVYSDKSDAVELALLHRSDVIALVGAGEVEDIKRELIELGKNTG